MSDVIIKAKELGEAIAASDVYIALDDIKAELETDLGAQELLIEYNGACQAFARVLESTDDSETVNAESEKIKALDERINENAVLSRLKDAQANYNNLMNKVNEVIAAYTDKTPSSCAGGCSGCSGCN